MASCKTDHFFSHWPRLVYGTWKNICPIAQLVFPAIQIHVTWPINEVKPSCLVTSSKKCLNFFFVWYHRLCDLKISEVEILSWSWIDEPYLLFLIFFLCWFVCLHLFFFIVPPPPPQPLLCLFLSHTRKTIIIYVLNTTPPPLKLRSS